MRSNDKVLIVGAGPSGLAAALFLSDQGCKPKIVEKEKGLSLHSKALGVNPQTLLLLEPSGLTNGFCQMDGRCRRSISGQESNWFFRMISPRRDTNIPLC